MNKNQNESVQQAADRPKTLRIVLSIVIAFFVWMAAMLAAPEITKAIRDVPITVDIPTSAMLEVVDGADTKVSLVLDGKQFEIGSYGPENVRVVADASAITEPGTYEVPLVVSDNGTRSYTVTSISPATVTLTFETRATKLLQIQADITGLTTPANYIAPEDEIVLEPSTVEVSGAESLISHVERAVIEVDFSREVTSTQQQNSKIVYYDAEGNKLETEEVAYFHQDVSSVAVTVPVKRVATLPLTVSFLNVPENFPVDELSYSLSVDSITVAAEDSVLRNHSSLVLGYIDFKQMNLLTSSQMDFAVQLPEGFTDMDDIEVVTVSFEADDLASTNLSLKNFQLVNVPEGFTVEMIAARCEDQGICSATEFLNACKSVTKSDFAYLADIPAGANVNYKVQGFLFPATYDIYESTTAESLVDYMLRTFDNYYTQELQDRAAELGYSAFELVTRASIVEREAKVDSERATIAGVINNRLKAEMPLQMCPTVLYPLTDGMYDKSQVLYEDLELDSPYNTYKNAGLPVGPICNPGLACIQAVLYPEEHNYLYYHVGDEDAGTHIFTENYEDHIDTQIIGGPNGVTPDGEASTEESTTEESQ